jgi:hypothetical protein
MFDKIHFIIILSTILFFIMFMYSGIDKIKYFNDKVNTLNTKLHSRFPINLLNFGMGCVIVLEIIGTLIILSRIIMGKNSPHILNIFSNITFILFILFLIVVTLLYHPFSSKKPIPFLSNCTTIAGIIFLFILSNSDLI